MVIFDDRDNRMTPSHARKAGLKYRYYLSAALLQGQPENVGSIGRIPAIEIESLVMASVRSHLELSEPIDDRQLVEQHIARVEIQPEQLTIEFADVSSTGGTLVVPWHKTAQKRHREILLPSDASPRQAHPIRSETRATLVASIARGRRWLDEVISDGSATTQAIAKREGCSVRKVNMTISLAFLAPNLVKAAIEGRLPRGRVSLASSTCPPNGLVSTKCLVCLSSRYVSNPVSARAVLRFGETEFWGRRRTGTERRVSEIATLQRPTSRARSRQHGAFHQRWGKSPVAQECGVEEAVTCEPVCSPQFPG